MTQPRYLPFMHGVYDVKAGIQPLGRAHGNGDVDGRVFQLDDHFGEYRAVKRAATHHPERHILREGFSREIEHVIARWVADRLVAEYPQHFEVIGGATLRCALTGDVIQFDDDPAALDALALQVQSDWAVLALDRDGGNRIPYLHVAMPSGWAPEEKVGRAFDAIHLPVPHIGPLNAKQDAIAKLMVNATRGAVRFAWTITTDPALNHHPLGQSACAVASHKARGARDVAPTALPTDDESTQPSAGDLHNNLPGYTPGDPLLRVERQVIWGFPEHGAALFTIRTYRYTLADLDAPARAALASAVGGMSDASLSYKNIDRAAVLARLNR